MKQSKAIDMAALPSVVLVAAEFMVAASVNHSVNEKDSIDPELALLGVNHPKELFESEEQKQQWYANLDEVKNRVRSEMPPYLHPEGPVIGYGYDIGDT